MIYLRAALGIVFFCVVAWAMSSHRKKFPWRVVGFGLVLQFALGGLLLGTEWGRIVFQGIADFVTVLVGKAAPGAKLVFGGLADGAGPVGYAFAFAGTGLVVIIFFSALMSLLYHLGVMQVLIYGLARVMSITMGVSGAEAMAMAANMFVGQTEAPLVVRPYIAKMTTSELNALMTGGFATIAGSVLAVYLGFLGEEIGAHLLTASVMSAPAAFLIAKIMQPETEESATGKHVELRFERNASNLIEAAANGTQDGLKLWLNVIAMLIAFMALINLIDWPLAWVGDNRFWNLNQHLGIQQLSLSAIFGFVFAPVAWFMGIEGWHDCKLFGSLLGTKIAVNEFIAFDALKGNLFHARVADYTRACGMHLGPMMAWTEVSALHNVRDHLPVFSHVRTAKMAAYALCGFANFASIGIQIGGISPLAPERKSDIARLAFRAMLGGAFASWMTATIAGCFV